MSDYGQWGAGVAMGFISLLGVFLFSRATDPMFATFGVLLFVFGLAGVIVLVHRATDYSSSDNTGDAAAGSSGEGETTG